MYSKNKKQMSTAEKEWVTRIKNSPCICCTLLERAPDGPSEAHEIEQGKWYLSVPLCWTCHQSKQGLHGDKTYLKILKVSELGLLNETLRRL